MNLETRNTCRPLLRRPEGLAEDHWRFTPRNASLLFKRSPVPLRSLYLRWYKAQHFLVVMSTYNSP